MSMTIVHVVLVLREWSTLVRRGPVGVSDAGELFNIAYQIWAHFRPRTDVHVCAALRGAPARDTRRDSGTLYTDGGLPQSGALHSLALWATGGLHCLCGLCWNNEPSGDRFLWSAFCVNANEIDTGDGHARHDAHLGQRGHERIRQRVGPLVRLFRRPGQR